MKENTHNEFDNLYKKAAENFPVNADGANWNYVLEQLEKKDKRFGFWMNKKNIVILLLLFSSLFFGSYYFFNNPLNGFKKTQVNEKNILENTFSNEKLKQEITASVYKKILDSLHQNNSIKNSTESLKKGENHFNQISKNTPKVHTYFLQNKKSKDNSKSIFSTSLINKNNKIEFDDLEQKSVANSKKINTSTNSSNNILSNTITNIFSQASDDSNKIVSSSKTIDSAFFKSPKTEEKNIVKTSSTKGIYAGLLYSFDNTSERKERHNEKGESFGISFLIGYKFSDKIALESGLSFQNREYYSNGNNFNKSILGATGNITTIESENSFFELPINIRYNFFNQKKFSLFSCAGTSSFFINKEKYEYEQENGGVYTKDQIEFSSTTTNIFATINFSVGCEYHFKTLGSLRLQPYYNLPTKSFANSGLSFVSKGVQIGWVYHFNKTK